MTFQRVGGYQKDKPKDQTKKQDGPRPNFGPKQALSDVDRQSRYFDFQQAVEVLPHEELVKIERIQRTAALKKQSQTGDSELDLRSAMLIRRLLSEKRTAKPVEEEGANEGEFVDESADEAAAMAAMAAAHHVPLAALKRSWEKDPEKYRAMCGMGPKRRNIVRQAQDLTNEAVSELDADGNSARTFFE